MRAFVLLMILFLVWTSPLLYSTTVCIDPGHCYKDQNDYYMAKESWFPMKAITNMHIGNRVIIAVRSNGGAQTKYDFTDILDIKPNWTPIKQNNGKNLGFVETALNLEVAKSLKKYLSTGSPSFKVVMTRTDQGPVADNNMDEWDRGRIAARNKADLLLSIHFNYLDAFSADTDCRNNQYLVFTPLENKYVAKLYNRNPKNTSSEIQLGTNNSPRFIYNPFNYHLSSFR
jgi:hypothetical protein